MAVRISPVARQQFFDNQGNVAVGMKLFTYAATTTTKLATFTSSTGLSQNTNPIILDAAGRTPSGLWLTDATLYKFVLAPANDTDPPASPIWTEDNIGTTEASLANLANTSNVALGDALIGFKQSNSGGALTGATGRTVHQKLQEFISVLDFGAAGDGVTDDTAAIQAAVTAAQITGKSVYLPAGNYLVSGTITFAKNIRFFGDGIRSFIKVAASVNGSTDILKVSPSATDDTQTFFIFEDFRIGPVSGTPGRHAIAIDITTRAAYSIKIRGTRLDALGGRGIVTLPNASPLVDGFFTSEIEGNTIFNGIYLDKAGDSIRIVNNVLTGSNVGVYADLVFVSAANTPHGLDIVGNNITTASGCIHIKNAYAARITRNIFESTAGNANNAYVDIDGTDATEKPDGVSVYENFFSTPLGVDAVRVNFARYATIRGNYIAEPGGGGFCFKVTSNAADTQILHNSTSADSTMATQLSDAGARTSWVRGGLSGRFETNQDHQFMQQGANIRMVDTAGTTIRLVRFDSSDNTVILGAFDAPASNGHLRFYANGAEAGRFTPTKQLLVNATSPPVTTIAAFNGSIAIKDNDTAPAATSGWAKIYVDTADGDLKIIFGDGTIKTIVTDT